MSRRGAWRSALAGERFDLLISSDLQRARETASRCSACMPSRARAGGLREQSFGVLEGMDVAGIKSRHPQLWAQWLRHDADYALPDGESTRRFHARVVDAVRALARRMATRRWCW